ncbi:PrsW family glutamic-type intramembrane protease [Streptococcus dysgalactiae]|uniref:PrsW family glutamic-type intramembrane protease n=1 Tax=Streptococcus dysgalactiae TaxID=1334 RepID=UPI0024B6B4C7|nr:PrsW family glutamic-type intramembrane protease [Streptococcus dysgalactiae]
MLRKITLTSLLLLSFYRLIQETLIITSLSLSKGEAHNLLFAIALLWLGYCLPIAAVAYYIFKKLGVSYYWFILAFVFGGLVVGHLTGVLNTRLADLLKFLFPNTRLLKDWIPSIIPPLVEETFKLGIASIVIYLSKERNLWAAMLLGVGTGLGFQLSEDHTYVVAAAVEKHLTPLHQSVLRFETAFSGHWLLTGILTVVIFMLYRYQSYRSSAVAYLYLCAPMILHILWNSPYIDGSVMLKIVLTLASWLILLSLCFEMKKNNFTLEH